jgi:hypothetical protein
VQFKCNRISEFGSIVPDSSENFEMSVSLAVQMKLPPSTLVPRKLTGLVSYIDFYKKSPKISLVSTPSHSRPVFKHASRQSAEHRYGDDLLRLVIIHDRRNRRGW